MKKIGKRVEIVQSPAVSTRFRALLSLFDCISEAHANPQPDVRAKLSRAAIYDVRVRTHLASLVEDFRNHANETAVVSHRGIRRYPTTYGELAHLAGRFAAELDRRNIAPGDRVLLAGRQLLRMDRHYFRLSAARCRRRPARCRRRS